MAVAFVLAMAVLALLMAVVAWQNVQYRIMLDDLHRAQNAKLKEPTTPTRVDGGE